MDNSSYNLINNFSIIACGARRAHLCTGAQHTLRAGIVRVDRELFHQIITVTVLNVVSVLKIFTDPQYGIYDETLTASITIDQTRSGL